MLDNLLGKIDINIKRKIAYITIAVAGGAHIFAFKSFFQQYLSIELLGQIDVGTVVGVITWLAVWLIYKRKM